MLKTNKQSWAETQDVDGKDLRLRKADTQTEHRAALRRTCSPKEKEAGTGLDQDFTVTTVFRRRLQVIQFAQDRCSFSTKRPCSGGPLLQVYQGDWPLILPSWRRTLME